jgi:DNA-binding response OmpR family regulator
MAYKILVVEDEENMRVLFKRVLGKAGYDVECAGSGAAKLKAINSQMPVVMISAYPSWGKKETAKRMGCADYLSKPVDMKYLKELIKKELGL